MSSDAHDAGDAHKSKSKTTTGDASVSDPFSSVKRNSKGGIHVSPSELHQAFEFFDVDGKGFITIQDLKKRLGVFYQNLSLREYKFLMNNKQELTEQELYALLANNELTNYDPVAEAFKIYDPNETGYIDLEVFREILSNLGFGDITDQDIQTLIDTADVRSAARHRELLAGHEAAHDRFQFLTDACSSSVLSLPQVDGDGRVSLADFRKMLPNSSPPPITSSSAAANK